MGPVTFFTASVAYGVTSRVVVLSRGVVPATKFTFTFLALLDATEVYLLGKCNILDC